MSTTPTDVPDWKIRLDERNARGHLEWAKEELMKAGAKMLDILKEVHDKRSWRFDFDSFEAWCVKELNMTKQRAHQLLSGANYLALLRGAGGDDVVPLLTESKIRNVKDVEPAKVIEAVREIAKDGKVTGAKLKQKVKPSVETPLSTEKLTIKCACPICGTMIEEKKLDKAIEDFHTH